MLITVHAVATKVMALTSAATAPTFYVAGSFDKDKARSCTDIVKRLNFYWISVSVLAYL
jgi:hypothetical protein